MNKSQSQPAFVLIEDNTLFAEVFKKYFMDEGVDHYSDPRKFLAVVDQYPKDTKIILDHAFPAPITGIDVAKELHQKGYTRLYLLSGDVLDRVTVPDYITVILKSDPDAVKKLI
jgi:DNA-binding response OmpR family regulator